MSTNDYTQLAITHCPIFYMHSEEKYFPAKADLTLDHASYTDDTGKLLFTSGDGKKLSTKIRILVDTCNSSTPNNSAFHLKIDEDAWSGNTPNGDNIFKENLSTAPIYVRAIKTPQYVELTYNQYCPYNGPEIRLGCIVAGSHESDYEHVRLRFTYATNMISGIVEYELHDIYFGAHGVLDGVWRRANDVDYEFGRVVVYCAMYSHAMYPKPGKYIMAGGISVDNCDAGHQWYPQSLIMIDETTPTWMGYTGKWGRDKVDALKTKGFWGPANTPNSDPYYSNTWYRRFFKCFGDCACFLKPYTP